MAKSYFVVFFILLLAVFLHFREVKVDHFKLGDVAQKYVLAEVGFDFADIEGARRLEEEFLREIGSIYYLNDEEILKAEQKIHDDLIQDHQLQDKFSFATFNELVEPCNTLRDILLKAKFSDPRTIQKLVYLNLGTKIEIYSTASLWDQIGKTAFATSTPFSNLILEKYQNYPWSLKEDFNLRQMIRQQIKEIIPIKKSHVGAGSRIINAGDSVSRRHLDMLREMKKVLIEEKWKLKLSSVLGSLTLSTMLIFLGFFYFKTFHASLMKSFAKMALIATVVLLTLGLAKLTHYFLLYRADNFVDCCRFPIFLIFASLTLSILVDRGVAMMTSIFIAIVLQITLGIESHAFLILNLSTAVMSIIWTKSVRKRREIFVICSKIWLMTLPLLLAINLFDPHQWHQLGDRQILIDFLATFFFIFVTAILVIATLPLLELVFGVVTDMTLMELGDPNHPLLNRLRSEAPGTYQHSLGVASLAEVAALAIGANALQCRVSSLYHDVGKIVQPHYFTENQFSGFNMHQLLTPLESAQVIIQHVTEGIKLAESHELPKPILNVIQEHHGTTLVYYFYHAQLEQSRVKALNNEEPFFHYPGPIPQCRESAIVMIADSIEAAYHCQEVVNEKTISTCIEEIVTDKIREHQLDESHLTFDDLEAVKKSIFRSLVALSHHRIKYPASPAAKQNTPATNLIGDEGFFDILQ